MPDNKADYVRTDELDEALVPLETLMTLFQVSRSTLERWLSADNITRHPFPGGKAVRWGDIPPASSATTRWQRPTPEVEP